MANINRQFTKSNIAFQVIRYFNLIRGGTIGIKAHLLKIS